MCRLSSRMSDREVHPVSPRQTNSVPQNTCHHPSNSPCRPRAYRPKGPRWAWCSCSWARSRGKCGNLPPCTGTLHSENGANGKPDSAPTGRSQSQSAKYAQLSTEQHSAGTRTLCLGQSRCCGHRLSRIVLLPRSLPPPSTLLPLWCTLLLPPTSLSPPPTPTPTPWPTTTPRPTSSRPSPTTELVP